MTGDGPGSLDRLEAHSETAGTEESKREAAWRTLARPCPETQASRLWSELREPGSETSPAAVPIGWRCGDAVSAWLAIWLRSSSSGAERRRAYGSLRLSASNDPPGHRTTVSQITPPVFSMRCPQLGQIAVISTSGSQASGCRPALPRHTHCARIRGGARSDLSSCSRVLLSIFGNFSMASLPGLAIRAPFGQRRLAIYGLFFGSRIVPSETCKRYLPRSRSPIDSVTFNPAL